MRRRDFITLIGGAATWPARAQQPAVPLVGFLHSAAPDKYARFVAAFQQGLRETGYIDGQNVAVEYGWAQGQYDRLPALAADMIAHRVSVIAATGGDPAESISQGPRVFHSLEGNMCGTAMRGAVALPGGRAYELLIVGQQL
jgi:hypothetical protein